MKHLFILFFSFIFLPLHGQVNIDSLKRNWNNTNLPDSIRISSINDLAWEGYLFTKPDSAFYFAQLHYNFAEEKGLTKEMAVARNTQGTSFYMSGKYAKAIEYFYESLRLKEKIEDYKGIAATFNNIGMIYDDQGDDEKAIEHYNKAIDYLQKIPVGKDQDKKILLASYHNIGVLYLNKEEYDKALEYFNRTLSLTSEHNFLRERAYTFSNMGNIYLNLNEEEKSIEYFNKAYDIAKRIGDENGIIDAMNNFSILYFRQQKYPQAIPYATAALNMARKNKATGQTKDAAEVLYLSYKYLERYDEALAMHELYISSRDSVQSAKNREEVLRQEFEYTYERQAAADSAAFAARQEIQELKITEQQAQIKSGKIQRLLLFSVLVLLASLSIVGYTGYKRKNKANEIISLQKREVEMQRDKISEQHTLLEEKSRKIIEFNNNLELLVEERTAELENSLKQIRDYQFSLAHKIRAPFVSLVGLLNLIKDERFDSIENKEVLQKLNDTSKRITVVLQDISRDLNKFDAEGKNEDELSA